MTFITPIKILTMLLLFAAASVSVAGENDVMDGRTLQSLCADYQQANSAGTLPDDSVKPYMKCAHFIQGVVETSVFYERMMYTVSGNHIFCFPKKTLSTPQAILVTNEYLRKHPERLDSRGVVLIMAAFLEAYPCN